MTKYTKKDLANDLKNLIGFTECYTKYYTAINPRNEKQTQELENEVAFYKEKTDALFSKILNNWKGE